tara:strand:+ start:3618 stop:6962 length:3345 start_codon:yes stop_codon:yes gene_type:complete
MNKEDPYNINNYNDEELYSILDLINPSDRELEAKINSLIYKYSNFGNESGEKITNFFKDIYEHFFDIDSDNDDIVEGMENINENETTINETNNNTNENNNNETNTDDDKVENRELGYNVDLEYSKGLLNPLLKQTTKRIVSIDSQYRDDKSSLTSDFTFNLSDPLRDVVSLRLYSIQIPYTWYTINSNYGSNFFLIKGNKNGINDGNHDLKIEIPIGNYTARELITSVNDSIQSLKTNTNYSDIEFNGTDISYNYANSKATLNVDISKHYCENQYDISFSNWITPLNSANRDESIPGFLGFNRQLYNGYRIYSSLETIVSVDQNNLNIRVIDNSNNFLRIVNYVSTSTTELINSITDNITSTSTITTPSDITILDDFSITLTNGTYTRINLINEINSKLQSNTNLFNESKIELIAESQTNIVGSNFNHYILDIKLNRFTTKNRINSKILVVLPNDNRIWKGSTSLFAFENYKYELSNIISESKPVFDNLDISDNDPGPQIKLTCNKIGFVNALNDYSITMTNGIYSLNEYINSINTSIINTNTINTENPNGVFNLSNTKALLNSESKFQLNIDINKTFNENNFTIDLSNSIFRKTNTNLKVNNVLDSSYNLETTNIFNINFNITSQGYSFDNGDNIFKVLSKTNDGIDVSYNIDLSLNQTENFTNINDLQRFLNNKIISFTDIDGDQIFKGSTISIIQSGITYELTLTIKINKFLTENDYNYELLGNSWTLGSSSDNKYLNIIDISNNISNSNNFFSIISSQAISSSTIEIDNTNNLISLIPHITTNSLAPSFGLHSESNANLLNITLTNGTYNRTSLISEINNKLSTLTTSNGNNIGNGTIFSLDENENVKIRLNINKTYTGTDYKVVFYDPTTFITYRIGNNIVTSTTWDATLGWILGFRVSTEYFLEDFVPINNVYSIIGDNVVSVSIYSYYLIILDDYNQNHLNDGIVTTTQKESNIKLPSYATRSGQVRDPITNDVRLTTLKKNGQQMTQKEIYAAQEILDSRSTEQNEAIVSRNSSLSARTVQYYSKGPFAKNVFALLPLKISGLQNNSIYVDYGGTLQNQERTYFGPVNIGRMTVKLMNDKGELVDLNGANWSFSFICEQLYQQKQT